MRRSRRRDNRAPLAEINIIPLVDVMLVLLVTFMVAAPLLQTGLDVNLPQVQAKPLAANETTMVITVKENGEIYVDQAPVAPDKLGETLREIRTTRANAETLLRADSNVPYGVVARVMGEVRRAGINRMAMITAEPNSRGD